MVANKIVSFLWIFFFDTESVQNNFETYDKANICFTITNIFLYYTSYKGTIFVILIP